MPALTWKLRKKEKKQSTICHFKVLRMSLGHGQKYKILGEGKQITPYHVHICLKSVCFFCLFVCFA